MNPSSPISIGYGQDPYETTRQALQPLAPAPLAGRSVLIKPRAALPLHTKAGITTHPRVLEAAIDWFRENGASAVAVADSRPLGSAGTEERDPDSSSVFTPDLTRVCREKEVLLVDIDHHDMIWIDILDGKAVQRLLTTSLLVDYDFIVSMPTLCTSWLSGAALSLENLHGLAARHHKLYFAPRIAVETPKGLIRRDQALADIAQVLYPDLVIIDGFNGMEGDGPYHGSHKNTGLILAGCDALGIDTVAARLMGLDPEHIDHLRRIQQGKTGHPQTKTILPQNWTHFITPFRRPDPGLRQRPPLVKIVNNCGCTSCQTAVYLFLEKHFAALNQEETIHLALGRGVEPGPRETFYVGTCASSKDPDHSGYHCSGCPAREQQIWETFQRVRRPVLAAARAAQEKSCPSTSP